MKVKNLGLRSKSLFGLLIPKGIKAWHLKLVDFMVKREADVLKISQAFSQPLLVIMTALSVEGGLF